MFDPSTQRGSAVTVNGVPVDAATLDAFAQRGATIPPGRYWYDARCGLWGYEGRGTAGLLPPMLPLGGPLPADASAGSTGVFINGRQLPHEDVQALQRAGVPVRPGRFWLNADGSCGAEGSPMPLVNLARALRSAGGDKSWGHTSEYGTTRTDVGGDGAGFTWASVKTAQGTTSYFFGD